jgi:hypothetical protein
VHVLYYASHAEPSPLRRLFRRNERCGFCRLVVVLSSTVSRRQRLARRSRRARARLRIRIARPACGVDEVAGHQFSFKSYGSVLLLGR